MRVIQNLDAVSMQLRARLSSRSSSAWTLAAHVDGKAVVVDNLFVENLVEVVGLFLFAMSIWTENSEYTGLWSENLDSPLRYHICFSPSPFHKIRSHLSSYPNKHNQISFLSY